MFKYLKLKYRNSCDIDNLYYQDQNFYNILFLDADIGKPEYSVVAEGSENGDKEFMPTFQKVKKLYKIEVLAPEYLVDALTLLPLHDNITLYDKTGESSVIKNIVIEPEWLDYDCFAKVTITFEQDYNSKTACCGNMIGTECLEPTYTVYAAILHNNVALNTHDNKFYLVIDEWLQGVGQAHTGNGYNIYYYDSSQEKWVTLLNYARPQPQVQQVIYCTSTGENYIDNIRFFSKYPVLSTATRVGGDFILKGYCPDYTFVQAYLDEGAGYNLFGSPISSAIFGSQGIIEAHAYTPGTTVSFKIRCYTHNCDYGYSNVVTYVLIIVP